MFLMAWQLELTSAHALRRGYGRSPLLPRQRQNIRFCEIGRCQHSETSPGTVEFQLRMTHDSNR